MNRKSFFLTPIGAIGLVFTSVVIGLAIWFAPPHTWIRAFWQAMGVLLVIGVFAEILNLKV